MSRVDNNYFTYRQTPATENGTGTLESIKGNTVVWNQLVTNGNFVNTDNWVGNGTITVSNNTMTYAKPSGWNALNNSVTIPIVAGHNYLVTYSAYVETNTAYLFWTDGTGSSSGAQTIYVGTTWQDFSIILTATRNNATGRIPWFDGSNVFTLHLKNYMVIDLTMLNDSRITDLDSFKSYYPLDYYAFNQGTLLSFNGNGIKTVGKNLWDNSQLIRGLFNDADFNYSSSQVFTSIKWYGFADTTYTISWGIPIKLTRMIIDEAHSVVSYDNVQTFTLTPTKDGYIGLSFRDNTSSSTQWNPNTTIQIEEGSSATSYEPYTSSTLSLPIEEHFPNGMNRAGRAYDELGESKAVKRTKIVNLGSINKSNIQKYDLGEGVNLYRINAPLFMDRAVGADSTGIKGLCSKYEWYGNTTTAGFANVPNKTFGFQSTATWIFIRDDSYTTIDDFYASLQDVYLCYELATETETDISPELDLTFNIDAGGTEELLPSSLMNGFVDLGSLEWTAVTTATSGVYRMRSSGISADVMKPSANNVKANVYNSRYSTITASENYQTIEGIAVEPNGNLFVYDSNFNTSSSATAFKNSLQGVYLWYQTTDSTPSTTPILCDIFYRGMIPVSVVVYPIGAGTVTGAGQYRYGETATLVATPNDIYRFLRYEDENGDTLSTDSTYSFEVGE